MHGANVRRRRRCCTTRRGSTTTCTTTTLSPPASPATPSSPRCVYMRIHSYIHNCIHRSGWGLGREGRGGLWTTAGRLPWPAPHGPGPRTRPSHRRLRHGAGTNGDAIYIYIYIYCARTYACTPSRTFACMHAQESTRAHLHAHHSCARTHTPRRRGRCRGSCRG